MRNKFILTEEEKRSILSMHNKRYISEAGPFEDTDPLAIGQPTQTSTTNTPAATTPNVIQKGKVTPKVMDLQNKLNDKLNSGLDPDGKWGPNTANAVLNALTNLPKKDEQTQDKQTQGDAIEPKLEIKPVNQLKIQTPSQNQTLAQGKPTTVRSAQDIKQGYREDQKLQRQGARQERRDTRQLEKQLKDLQSTYKKLEGKMTPQDKTSYQTQIKQLKDKLSQK